MMVSHFGTQYNALDEPAGAHCTEAPHSAYFSAARYLLNVRWQIPLYRLLLAGYLTLQPLAGYAEHVVGVFAPLTGPHALLGRSLRNGVVLALEQAEDGGRFGDVRLSIRAVDDSGTPKAVAERVTKFVRDEYAILVIGPTVSSHAEAAADLANHLRFPLLAPGASEGITATGKWAFRLTMSPYKTLHALAAQAFTPPAGAANNFASTVGVRTGQRLALAYAKGNRGYASQTAEFRAAAVRSGARVVGEFEVDVASDFLSSTGAAVSEAAADVVFFAMDAEPGAALAYAIAARSNAAPAANPPVKRPLFVFSPAAAQAALTRIGGTAVEQALTAADYLPEAQSEANTQFRAAYQARYGEPANAWAGIGFAAGQLAAEAIRNAGPNPTTETVRLALERVNGIELLIGRGRWQQDAGRNPAYAPQLYVVQSGKLAPVSPVGLR